MEPKGWTGPRGTELASARAGTALPLSAAPAAPVELLVVVAVAQAAQAAAVFLGLLVILDLGLLVLLERLGAVLVPRQLWR